VQGRAALVGATVRAEGGADLAADLICAKALA
jgi:hypothetical protein